MLPDETQPCTTLFKPDKISISGVVYDTIRLFDGKKDNKDRNGIDQKGGEQTETEAQDEDSITKGIFVPTVQFVSLICPFVLNYNIVLIIVIISK